MKELNDEIKKFHESKKDAVFVMFIGALNHWLTLVVHNIVTTTEIERKINRTPKPKSPQTPKSPRKGQKIVVEESSDGPLYEYETIYHSSIKFYLLDSSNYEFLDLSDREVLPSFNQRVKSRVDSGLKPTDHFGLKMKIQSVFDARYTLMIMQDIFLNKTPLNHYYAKSHLHNKLRFFHNSTIDVIKYYEECYADLKKQNEDKLKLTMGNLTTHGDKSINYDELFKEEDEESEGYGFENNTTSIRMRVMRFDKPRDRMEIRREYKDKVAESKG